MSDACIPATGNRAERHLSTRQVHKRDLVGALPDCSNTWTTINRDMNGGWRLWRVMSGEGTDGVVPDLYLCRFGATPSFWWGDIFCDA